METVNQDLGSITIHMGSESYYNVDGEWKVVTANMDPVVSNKMNDLHKRFPALQKAWDEYMTLYNLCCGENNE